MHHSEMPDVPAPIKRILEEFGGEITSMGSISIPNQPPKYEDTIVAYSFIPHKEENRKRQSEDPIKEGDIVSTEVGDFIKIGKSCG